MLNSFGHSSAHLQFIQVWFEFKTMIYVKYSVFLSSIVISVFFLPDEMCRNDGLLMHPMPTLQMVSLQHLRFTNVLQTFKKKKTKLKTYPMFWPMKRVCLLLLLVLSQLYCPTTPFSLHLIILKKKKRINTNKKFFFVWFTSVTWTMVGTCDKAVSPLVSNSAVKQANNSIYCLF